MNKTLVLLGLAVMTAFGLAACKDEKKPVTGTVKTGEYGWVGTGFDFTCSSRGGSLVKVEDSRILTCKLPVEGVGDVEMDKTDPWFEPKPEAVVETPVVSENKTYVSDWDKGHVEKLDAKDIKLNPVQEKKVVEQKESDIATFGPDVKELYAHAPNKKFKETCDSHSGKVSKIHGGKWVCRYKE